MTNKSIIKMIKMILYIFIVLCMFFPGAIVMGKTLVTDFFDGGWGSGIIMGKSNVSMLGAIGKIGGLNSILIVMLLVISVLGAVYSWRESNIGNENYSLCMAIAEAATFAALRYSIGYNHCSDIYWVYTNRYQDYWYVSTIFYLILVAVCAVLVISIYEYVVRKKLKY